MSLSVGSCREKSPNRIATARLLTNPPCPFAPEIVAGRASQPVPLQESQPTCDIRHNPSHIHELRSRRGRVCPRLCSNKTLSAAVYGIDASIIEVEVDVSGVKTSENHSHTVGLPDAAVRESRDRVRAALKNCGYDIPLTHITINLAPADIRKEGSGFDLPMALGILGAYGGLNKKEVPDCLFVGELSLDGGIRSVRGALPIAIEAPRGRFPGSSCLNSMPKKLRWSAVSLFIP